MIPCLNVHCKPWYNNTGDWGVDVHVIVCVSPIYVKVDIQELSGCKSESLTALRVMSDMAWLSLYSPSVWTKSGPAAWMSALEPGRISILACPLLEAPWLLGAGTIWWWVVFTRWLNGKPDVWSDFSGGCSSFISFLLGEGLGGIQCWSVWSCHICDRQTCRLSNLLPPSCCLLPQGPWVILGSVVWTV